MPLRLLRTPSRRCLRPGFGFSGPQASWPLRVLTVGAAAAALWAAVDTDFSTISILGAAHGLVLVGIALNQLIGDRFADGASYGDERRMLLRPPALFGYVLTPVVTAVVIAGVAAGPLLLANRSWVLGGVVTVVGFAAAAAGLRAIHQLAQRWIVFVPTGMVLHDLMALTEPVLFRRTAIERLGPAIAGTPARDLSGNAAGLMLECELTDPAPLGLRTPGDKDAAAKLTDVRRFTFSPTRPGALLEEADRRNIAVG